MTMLRSGSETGVQVYYSFSSVTDHKGVRVEGGDPVVAGLQLAQLEALHHAVVVTQLLNLIPLHMWVQLRRSFSSAYFTQENTNNHYSTFSQQITAP